MKTILICCMVILGATLITAGDGPGDEYSAGQTLFRKNCEFCHILKPKQCPTPGECLSFCRRTLSFPG